MASDVVYDAFLGAATIRQVTDSRFSANAQAIHLHNSGSLAPTEIVGGPADPMCSLSTMDLSGVISGLSMTAGLAVASGTITVPWQKRSNLASFAGGSNNFTISATDGLIVPMAFRANQDDEGASADVDVHFLSTTGLALPYAMNASAALASQAFVAQYALGPCSINGTTIGEVTGATVNTGIEVVKERHNGGQYPDRIYIVRTRPSIDLTFNNFDQADTLAQSFAVMTAAIVYFRKRAGASFTSDVTTAHVKLSFADGLIVPEVLSASQTASGQATVRLYGEALTASASSAIS